MDEMGVEVVVAGTQVSYGSIARVFVLWQGVNELETQLRETGGVFNCTSTTGGLKPLAKDIEYGVKASAGCTEDTCG